MEKNYESTAPQKSSKMFLGIHFVIKTFRKYACQTLLVLLVIVGSQAFRTIPEVTPASAHPGPLAAAPGALLHSTLNDEVFQKFVNGNGTRMYPRLSREIVDAAYKYSEKYDLSPILVLAIANAESQFYPFALSKRNAKGLMQINLDANQQLLIQERILKDPSEIFDPDRNIEAGCFLLRQFINASPDLNSALDKYLGSDSASYKAEIHRVMGKIMLFGITEQLNQKSKHKIPPIAQVEAPVRHSSENSK
jgi:hypothetical protein